MPEKWRKEEPELLSKMRRKEREKNQKHQRVHQKQKELQSPALDTTSSKICRICRLDEGTVVRLCSCSGSVAFCHATCVIEWTRVSGSENCEICGSKFNKVLVPKLPLWEIYNPTVGTWPLALSFLFTFFRSIPITNSIRTMNVALCVYQFLFAPYEKLRCLKSQIWYFMRGYFLFAIVFLGGSIAFDWIFNVEYILNKKYSFPIDKVMQLEVLARVDELIVDFNMPLMESSIFAPIVIGLGVFSLALIIEWINVTYASSLDFNGLEDLLQEGNFQLD